ncbi:hypothetical protein [Duganella aquatilis]|uniref:hypothetical protein n=1 Tax=Duganella aquatilis TaxID=2666082 RepID=UPI003FCE09C3
MIRFAGELTAEDMANLYGRSRLVRNEVNLLFGLAVKVEIDYEFPEGEVFQAYVTRSESLLEALHQAMLLAVPSIFSAASDSVNSDPKSSGAMIRESIFYGGESAYSFQNVGLAAIASARAGAGHVRGIVASRPSCKFEDHWKAICKK